MVRFVGQTIRPCRLMYYETDVLSHLTEYNKGIIALE